MKSTETIKTKELETISIHKEAKRVIITKDNYGVLETVSANRGIIPSLVKRMYDSVNRNGILRDIIVIWSITLKKYLIVDGQHLTNAIMLMGGDIGCRIVDVTEDNLTQLMIDLNNTSKSWSLSDYIHGWSENGVYDYKQLQKTIKGSKIQDTIILMAYTQKDRAMATKLAKTGKFEIVNKTSGDRMLKQLTEIHKHLPNTRVYNQAVMTFLIKTKDYNHEQMLKNLKKKVSDTYFSTKEKEIYNQLFNIYNS